MAAQTPTDVDAPGAADTSTLHRTPSTYSGETVSADRPEKPVDDGTTPLDQLGDTPEEIHCPFCHQRTHTRIEVKKNIIKKVWVNPPPWTSMDRVCFDADKFSLPVVSVQECGL